MSHSPKIYHYKKKNVPKSSFGMEDLEAGEFYALHTSEKGYDLVHVLKETDDSYKGRFRPRVQRIWTIASRQYHLYEEEDKRNGFPASRRSL